MNTEKIDRRQHPQVRFLKRVRKGEEGPLLFIEGLRLIEEALRSGLSFQAIYATEEAAAGADFKNTVTASGRKPAPITLMNNDAMGFVSDMESAPGVIGIAPRLDRPITPETLSAPGGLWVVILGVQIPSNVGAILRAAEAAGVSGVFVTRGGASPFAPKALRAASGSAFRLAISEEESWKAVHDKLSAAAVRPVFADAHAETSYTDCDWKEKTALILGAETRGAASEIAADIDRIKIPMQAGVESLNVAVAAGILLFEARRQKTLQPPPP